MTLLFYTPNEWKQFENVFYYYFDDNNTLTIDIGNDSSISIVSLLDTKNYSCATIFKIGRFNEKDWEFLAKHDKYKKWVYLKYTCTSEKVKGILILRDTEEEINTLISS